SLILLFGWMEAKMTHLQKYSQVYSEKYPHTLQLILRCPPSFFFTSTRAQSAILEPAVRLLEDEGYVSPTDMALVPSHQIAPRPRILVHVFSNGGAYVLTSLSAILATRSLPAGMPSANEIPTALILDSTPGKTSIQGAVRAFTAQMRYPLLRWLVATSVWVFGCALFIYHDVLNQSESTLSRTRRILNSPNLLPWTSRHTPRLYIYSLVDELVPSADIDEHIADAIRLGCRVNTEVFESSAHVSHMRKDPARYWGAVQKTWDIAVSTT
ncbi:hypothetical protein K488DRAFT_49709, partial [Vararia minispora EC-137]